MQGQPAHELDSGMMDMTPADHAMQHRLDLREIARHCALILLLLVSACSPLPRYDAVPIKLGERATVQGLSDIRFWADTEDTAAMIRAGDEAERRQREYLAQSGHQGPLPPANFLAISGGGENGAFGAGLLVGWTAAGTRPRFDLVTGVSTGALTAPFAFLGPAYDDALRQVYTGITADDVLQRRSLLAALFQDAIADNAPLRATIGRYFTQEMLDAITAEYGKGRVLLIGTTDLDARRKVIWNIGAIAERGGPGALDLVHDILLASAAIPGIFPPVMINVEVDGKIFQEMHVDGGASAQVFLYPPSLDRGDPDVEREERLYVIRNARLDPGWAQVERRTLSIAARAIFTLIHTQGVGDLFRIYLTAQRDGHDFNLAYIPRTFTTELNEPFDTEYMNELFELGYDLAVKGYRWEKAPPGFATPQIEPR
jgi:predicted acylesterase/phospholipase RssA